MTTPSACRLAAALLLLQLQVPGVSAQEKMHGRGSDNNQPESQQPQAPQRPQVPDPPQQPQQPNPPQQPGQPQRPRQPPGPRVPEPPKPLPPGTLRHDHHAKHSTQQSRAWQQNRGWQKPGAWEGRKDWDGGRATHWQNEHRTWAQRDGYGGRFIPRNHFRQFFGPEHGFRIEEQPVLYMGYPRFGYHGYSFIMVDPWPEDWDARWYATDELYIDYDDGYYLHNRNHPEVFLAVSLVE